MFYTPMPHQVEDSDSMLEYNHAFLWADPGTGKTVTALEAWRKGGYEKAVIIAPKIALSMWYNEIKKHHVSQLGNKVPHVLVLRSSGFGNKQIQNFHGADALITTPDIAAKMRMDTWIRRFVMGPQFAEDGRRRQWDEGDRHKAVLILDEAHYFKSRDAKRSKAITSRNGSHRHFDDTWQLTGTPIMRYCDDLWSQMCAFRRDIFKHYGVERYEDFVDKFCTTEYRRYSPRGPMQKVVTGNKNQKLLSQLIADCMVLQRRLADVEKDLPPITERVLNPGISTKTLSGVKVPKDEASLIRLLNDPESGMAKVRRLLGLAKVEGVCEYISTGEPRMPLLLGFWHKEVGQKYHEQILKTHPRLAIEIVDGSTPSNVRDVIQTHFNEGRIDILLGQMSAMSTSWNLQGACSHVIVAEELPSPGMLEQFIARVYRKGQERHVQVDHMTTLHDLDEALARIRRIKKSDTSRILA